MKNLILIVSMIFSIQGYAQENTDVYQAELNEFNINHGYLKDVTSGNVTVDLAYSNISLFLQPAYNCPDGKICATVMPEPVIITLELQGFEENECGWMIYTAERDKTPVDGLLEQITVVDYSKNTCPTFLPLPATTVNYSSYSAWIDQWTHSDFNGETLRLLPVIFR